MDEKTSARRQSTRKKPGAFTQLIRRFCVPIFALLLIVIAVLTAVLIAELSKENKLKDEKEQQIASLSSEVEKLKATAAYK